MKRFLFISATIWALLVSTSWAADRESITLCSYNLKNYLRMDRFVKGTPKPEQPKPEKEITAVVKFLVQIKPDALGLCEIGQEADLRDLQRRLKEAGLDLPNSEYCHGGDPTRRLALLTRLPIIARNSQTDLKYQIGEQVYPMQRGLLDVTLEVKPGLELRCLGVHLKSKRPVPEADESLMRRNEAHLLRKHLDEIIAKDAGVKVLLYGDFNEHRHEAPVTEITGTPGTPGGLYELHLRDERNETWTHYWKDADVYSRFDYIFFTKTLAKYMDRKSSHIFDTPDYYDGSDHRPIVCRIRLQATR